MEHEALIRKYFDMLDTAWMPEKDREECFSKEVLPYVGKIVADAVAAGLTDAQVEPLIKRVMGVPL